MKQSFKRLTALILALSMALSLLCGSAWAAEIDPADAADEAAGEVVVEETPEEDIPEESAEESVEPETPEESVEEVMEPEIPEEPAEESVTAESVEEVEESEETEAATAEPEETETLNNTAGSGTCGDNLTWTLDDEGTLTISGSGEITESNWDNDITSVVIEEGVTGIGDWTFYNCASLTSVTFPSSLTSIGECAFESCTSLTSLTIPASVTDIGSAAFNTCTSLESVIFDEGVSSTGEWTFEGCTSLKSVAIPASVTSIGEGTFYGCSGMEGLTIPASVTSIGAMAFSECTSLTSVTIPDGVTSIGVMAFSACMSLTSVTIPASVTSMNGRAFTACYSLSAIEVSENNPSYSSVDGVVFDKDKTTLISYPAGKAEPNYTIPNGVTSLGESAFENCDLTGVTIPDSMTSIGDWVFFNCSNLTDVNIPDGVTSVGEMAFGFCNNLTSVSIPASVTSIGWEAFGYILDEETYENILLDGFTISGYTGSAAETYARNNGFTFIPLGTVPFVADLSACTISLSPTSYTYNGKARTPAVTVKYNDKELVQDTDYIVNYKNNTDAGTATVTIKGRGGYSGTKTKKFTIKQAANTISAKNFTKTYSTKKQTFSIGAKSKGNGKITYTSNNKYITVNKTTGKVTVKAKYIGTATITIKVAAKGNYAAATKKITVTVNPTKTTLSSVKNSASKKMTVKWKKNTVGTGYQIQYSTSKTFAKGNKTATISKKTTTSKTISGLKKGKTYYVRIRTYKTVSGKKIYSAWSSKKSVKIKK